MVSVSDLLFFFLRQSIGDTLQEDVEMSRVQKRLVHLIGQRVEVVLASPGVEVSTDAPSLAPQPLQMKQSWSTSRSRNQTADLLRQELIKRFMCKATGFVLSTRNSHNQDLSGSTNDNSSGLAASQLVTAYFAKAADMMFDKLSKQHFRHLAYYHDAAKVATYDVSFQTSTLF